MADFFAFRRMLTPVLVQISFWMLAIASILYGVYIWGNQNNVGLALAFIILGPLIARVWAEVVIILFAIHSSLNDIRSYFVRQPPMGGPYRQRAIRPVRPEGGSSDFRDASQAPDADEAPWRFPRIDHGLAPLDVLDAVDVAAADLWDEVAIDHDADLYEQRNGIEGDLAEYERAAVYLTGALHGVSAVDDRGEATIAANALGAAIEAIGKYVSLLETLTPQTADRDVIPRLQVTEDRIDRAYERFKESIARLDPDYEPAFDSNVVA